MSINIVSTTDTSEQVLAAMGGSKAEPQKEVVEKSEETKKVAEKEVEQSDAQQDESQSESENEDQESEDSGEDGEQEKDEPKKKRKSGFERRISKLNAKISLAEKEAQKWREIALAQKGDEPQEKKEEQKSQLGEAPNPDDFDHQSDYIKALVRFEREQEEKSSREKQQVESARKEYQSKQEQYNKHADNFRKETPDFDDVIVEAFEELGNDYPLSLALDSYIKDLGEMGPRVVYELAKDPKNLDRINNMSVMSMGRELGRIESRLLENQQKPKTKPTTKAPPPMNPVGSRALAEKDPEDMTYQEYKKWAEAKNS